nr:MAG TPA: hypothetical protein [Herelleviridae sp.]
MVTIVSTIYKDTVIQFDGELVKFTNGKSVVKDETWEYIKAGGFKGITSLEDAEKMGKEKSEREKDDEDTIKVLKDEYDFEISRLNGIINDKNAQIEKLKQAADVWRKECERLMNGGKPKEIEEEKKEEEENPFNEEEIASLKEDMSKMTFEDLKTLAIENGMSKQKAGRFKEENQKDELINAIIALPKK